MSWPGFPDPDGRAQSSVSLAGSPDPDLFDHFPMNFGASPYIPGVPVSDDGRRGITPPSTAPDLCSPPCASASPRRHAPSCLPVRLPRAFAASSPACAPAMSPAGRLSGCPPHHGHRADDQQSPNVLLSHLRRSAEPLFIPGRVLPGHETQPGREVPAAPEGFHRWREGFNGQSANRPDARHGLQSAGCVRRAGQFAHPLRQRIYPGGLSEDL